MIRKLACALLVFTAACADGADKGPEKVATSGKSEVKIDRVPPEVLAAANAARAGFTAEEAERETREGRQYYDIEGKLADGSEIEFDIMQDGDGWKVVEVQRDIAFGSTPEPVRAEIGKADANFAPYRVIESTQTDGVVIYELFGPEGANPQGNKVEVKWDGRTAEILTEEWAH